MAGALGEGEQPYCGLVGLALLWPRVTSASTKGTRRTGQTGACRNEGRGSKDLE